MDQISSFRYAKGPVKVSVQKVIEYPLHWDDCIEIVMVLEGSILLERDFDFFYFFIPQIMKENDIFAVSINETHRIHSSYDNVVLIIQIDGDFIRQNFADVTILEFASLLTPKNDLEKEKIEYLKQLTMYLASLVTDPQKEQRTEIEKTAKVLLYTLIYNFNMINRALDSCKSDIKYQRFLRSNKYLIENIHRKKLLQEIAEREHLNPASISHEIKRYFVYSFQEHINDYRIRKALKMLLSTDKNICDIAYECGFSAPRYFHKSFNQRFSQSPVDFRKKHQKDYQNINYLICYEEVENADNYIKSNHNKLTGKDIEWLKIDANSHGPSFTLNGENHLNILKSKDLLNPQTQNYLRTIQKEFAFQNIKLYDLFNDEIQMANSDFSGYNWNNVNSILRFIIQLGYKPIISLRPTPLNIETYKKLISQYLRRNERKLGNKIIKNLAFEIDRNCDSANELIKIISEYTKNIFDNENIDSIYPPNSLSKTIYMATYLIKEALQNHNIDFLQIIDHSIDEDSNNKFSGLFTENGLLKPSFHACSLLALLGNELIEKGDYYIVTKKEDSLQILLYNHLELSNDINEDDFYNNYLDNKDNVKKINIFIKNINQIYKVIRYELNNENGSVYYHLRQMRNYNFLNNYDIKLLNNKISTPKVKIDYIEGDTTFNINLQPYSTELITLDLIKS